MKRMKSALIADVKFQFRQGFYFIYLILTVIYLIIIKQIGSHAAVFVVPVVIFCDPSLIGFFFIGGLVLLEKQQGVTGYIGITPVTTGEYMWSKIISLTVLALVASLGIAIFSGAAFNFILLSAGVILSSLFFTLIGFLAVSGCQTMNDYFIKMIPSILLIVLPAIGLIDSPWTLIFRLTPTFAGLRMMMSSFGEVTFTKGFLDGAVIAVWCLAIYFPIKKRFDAKAIRGE